MHVRIIEDERMIAEMLQVLLVSHGHPTVVTCENFADVLTPLPWVGIDAVLVDLMLGEATTGVDVLAYLAEFQPKIRRIVLSALDSGGDLRQAAHRYTDMFLTKPLGIDTILTALE